LVDVVGLAVPVVRHTIAGRVSMSTRKLLFAVPQGLLCPLTIVDVVPPAYHRRIVLARRAGMVPD